MALANGTKKCGACRRELPRTAFSSNQAKHDGLSSQCRECKKQTQHAWYQKHRTTHLQNVRDRDRALLKENKQKLFEYLLAHPCVDCGEKRPYVLDFDHRAGDGERKEKAVSIMLRDRYSWGKILREIGKCDVRCAVCHRARHAKSRNSTLYHLWVKYTAEL